MIFIIYMYIIIEIFGPQKNHCSKMVFRYFLSFDGYVLDNKDEPESGLYRNQRISVWRNGTKNRSWHRRIFQEICRFV